MSKLYGIYYAWILKDPMGMNSMNLQEGYKMSAENKVIDLRHEENKLFFFVVSFDKQFYMKKSVAKIII